MSSGSPHYGPPSPSRRRPSPFVQVPTTAGGAPPWGALEAVASTLGLALLLYFAVQRSAFRELLGLSRVALSGDEAWLLPASVVSTSLVLLSPGLAAALVLLGLRRWRASRRCFVALSSSVLFLLALDLDLLRSVGRHLSELVGVALQPRGHVASGDGTQWARMVASWLALAALASWSVARLAHGAARAAVSRLTPLLRRTLGWILGAALLLFVPVPHLMHHGWRTPGLYERLYGALLVDLRVTSAAADDSDIADPALRDLYPRLRSAYRTAFPTLGAGKAARHAPLALPPRPPHVVLIVTESLRRDVFGPELMPRLTRWAERGLRATEHDAGTIYSQSGLFALLYGRSPALFHQTLNAQVPPQLCASLRASGYECAYFSGHPQVWMRREEFVNERTMDHFVHDDRGSWPEWDARALDNMVEMVSTSDKPLLAIVLLMSSHFEYQYPPRYEVDRPVSDTTWHVTRVQALGPEAELPHRNRYRNCMRFLDDLVSNAIERLDPERNLVIFTGDHGESINDDGRYTHGYSFAEVVTHTPLAMVGPGVPARTVAFPTYHADVLPSVMHVLQGSHVGVPHTQGRDWFENPGPSSALLAHSPPGERVIQAQLRAHGLRLRLDLDMRAPQVRLLGFEDALGRLMPSPELSPSLRDGLAAAFEEQLLALRR